MPAAGIHTQVSSLPEKYAQMLHHRWHAEGSIAMIMIELIFVQHTVLHLVLIHWALLLKVIIH